MDLHWVHVRFRAGLDGHQVTSDLDDGCVDAALLTEGDSPPPCAKVEVFVFLGLVADSVNPRLDYYSNNHRHLSRSTLSDPVQPRPQPPKATGQAARAASKKKARLKGRVEEERPHTSEEDVPPCQNGYWIRAPTKREREALPRFPTLKMHHIHIPRSKTELTTARTALLAADVLGFDTETRPAFVKGRPDTGGPHLVQLSTKTDAWLLMIHRVPGALALAREVMAEQSIMKVGFGLANDVQTLPGKLGAQLRNVYDFDSRFAKVGYGKSLGVRGAVAVVFNQDFRKAKKQTLANWASDHYNDAMILYAANDAYIPTVLWAEMARWDQGRVDTPKWFKAGVQRIARERATAQSRGLTNTHEDDGDDVVYTGYRLAADRLNANQSSSLLSRLDKR
ncbi:hypothetical protein CcaverHIS641_0301080 [Cutaneotrichosporon cavernicola]|nr:hypothetical protein CcaverHIS641_0301080 [Cutaneotrichosporon cavernicola]